MPLALAGRGGADVEAYVRRARGAARRGRRQLQLDDLLAEVRSNREPPSPQDRRRVAVHEAGHAVAATSLGRMEVIGVSIGDRGGLTQIVAIDGSTTPGHCNDIMVMLLAGRAAGHLVLGSPSAGAGGSPDSDLSLATELAKKIELRFGFGEYGPVFLPDGAHDPLTTVPGLLIAVKRRLERAMADADELLTKNMAVLDAVADALDRSGYLSAGDVSYLVGKSDACVEHHGVADTGPQRYRESVS